MRLFTLKNFNIFFFIGLALFLMNVSACSMQKSGSKVDSLDNRTKSGKQFADKQSGRELTPLRVDYLTPVSKITRPEVYVYKEKRRLYVIQSNVLVRDYPIGLGFSPKGDKQTEGDGKTPEGNFLICVKNPASRFIKSLGLNYPDRKHAERALFAGIITPPEFRGIVSALERTVLPPSNTDLGGQIFIHAGGAHKDWTNGCIALYNRDMDELFSLAGVGTPVSIRP